MRQSFAGYGLVLSEANWYKLLLHRSDGNHEVERVDIHYMKSESEG